MYHVFVRLTSSDEDQCLFTDLSEAELNRRFVNPYLEGKDIYNQGSITRVAEISKVFVITSELTADATLQKMAADHQAELERIKREENRNVLGSHRGRKKTELIGYCEDVTESMIARAPGSGTRRTKIMKFLHNPWLVRVGGGVVLLVLGILIGRIWGNG